MNDKSDVKKKCWELLLEGEKSIREIASDLKVSKTTVMKWKEELQDDTGEVNVPEEIELEEQEEKVIVATKDKRTRNWTGVIYPDSCPDDYEDIIDSWHVPVALSPLHDSDVNADGTEKKAHRHLIIAGESKKSYNQVLEMVAQLHGAKKVQPVRDMRAMVRYLVHMDNPEKTQYSLEDVKCFGGFDVADYLHATSSEKYKYIREMQSWVLENNCRGISDLMDYAATERFEDWFPLLCDSCTYVMSQYIASRKEIRKEMNAEVNRVKQLRKYGDNNEDC